MRRLLVAVLAGVLVLSACSDAAESDRDSDVSSVPTVLILDGSGSMNESDAPGPRIDAAKAAAKALISAVPDDAEIALQTYGTASGSAPSDKAASCQDVTMLVPLGPLDRSGIQSAVTSITPSGYTPISLALQSAAEQLPAGDAPQAIVLVSDGEETCDIPPCDVAAQLKQDRPGLTISTVGFRVDGPAADQLRCIADIAGGLFVQASNADQLAARLLATQDIDQANSSLSATGIYGVNLGDTIADIRAKHRDFPDASGAGRQTIIWQDCYFEFLDGTLQSINPHTRARTIDGIMIGYPVGAATELYGQPIAATTDGDGTITFTYDSDPLGDAAYQITADASGPLTGTIKSIILCRCKGIASSEPVRPDDVTDDTIRNMTFPPGTCGDDSRGWKHEVPIVVTNGDGEARSPSGEFGGASITEATLAGWLDADGDGTEDAVVSFTCFGSTFDMCCAGRTSMTKFLRVFDFSDSAPPRPIGDTIGPGESPVRGESYGEPRYIDQTRIDGSTIITEEKLAYADTTAATADLDHSPFATIEVTHRFVDGQWTSTESVLESAGCDAAAISADIGSSVSVVRCYDNWAYVTNGSLGDSTSLAQRVGDSWQRYTGFPSSFCRADAAADGVPEVELSSFRPC